MSTEQQMAALANEVDLERPTARELRLDDRCDSCNQQAVGIAVMRSGTELLFCGHHLRRHRKALLDNPALKAYGEPDDLDPYTFGPPPNARS